MNRLRLQKTDSRKTLSGNIYFGQKTINTDGHVTSVSVKNQRTAIANKHGGEPAVRRPYAPGNFNSAGILWIRIDSVPENTRLSAPITLKIKQDISHV